MFPLWVEETDLKTLDRFRIEQKMGHKLVFLQKAPYATGYYVCDLCQERGSGSVFHCSACHFDLHPVCIATGEQESHFSHFQHPLQLQTLSSNKTHTCDGCGESAFPLVYTCSPCDFDLHPHCMRAPRFVQHSSHKHVLKLVSKEQAYPGGCWCDACGAEAKKMVYHCEQCKFDLHISCIMLPSNPLHAVHPEHRLKLMYRSPDRGRRMKCIECGKDASKWTYECEVCGFYVHAMCAQMPSHEVVAPSSSSDAGPPSPASSHDVEAVVKVMDKLLLVSSSSSPSSAEAISTGEARAMLKVKKMLEQQQQLQPCDPISRSSVSVSASIVRDGDDQHTCPACLDAYDVEKQRRNLRCGHHFHTGCILRWMESSNRCPVCRQQIILLEEPS